MNAHVRCVCWVLVVCLTLAAGNAMAQDSLASVRELYASASYEDVLSMLARLEGTPPSIPRVELERYRVFSLTALGRAIEASQVIDRIIDQDPLYLPDQADTPPRVAAAFRDGRRRMLPDIAKKRYADAKANFDRKEYGIAAVELERVMRIIDDPDILESAGLGDLRMLATGFLDLSRAAMTPSPASTVSPVPASAVPPEPAVVAAAPVEPTPAAAPSSSVGAVTPPVPLRENLPAWPSSGRQFPGILQYTGILRINIDQRGDVESVTLLKPLLLHPQYNELLLRAARSWKYRPAEQDGKPVKSVRTLEVVLQP